jgi:tetratricopeptide (TPR) repeat protein
MSADRKLFLALEAIDRETASLPLQDAIALIDTKLRDPEFAKYQPNFDVHKSILLRSNGQGERAVELLCDTAKHFPDVVNVHYFAGECLLELGQFEAAIQHLNQCIELVIRSGDTWFQDSAYLLRAYSAAKTGGLDLARDDLEHVHDDEAMFWINADPVVSKETIIRMIAQSGQKP